LHTSSNIITRASVHKTSFGLTNSTRERREVPFDSMAGVDMFMLTMSSRWKNFDNLCDHEEVALELRQLR
jgi:hypothetical protein